MIDQAAEQPLEDALLGVLGEVVEEALDALGRAVDELQDDLLALAQQLASGVGELAQDFPELLGIDVDLAQEEVDALADLLGGPLAHDGGDLLGGLPTLLQGLELGVPGFAGQAGDRLIALLGGGADLMYPCWIAAPASGPTRDGHGFFLLLRPC